MQTLHVQQRCVPPPFDIDRCIDVGVVSVTTIDANEARLAFAASRIDDVTCGAGLAREPGRDGHDLTAAFLHLVGEDRRELVPARVEDHAVEPRFLANIAAWSLDRAPRRGGHAARVQVFEHDDTVAAADIERSAVVEVAADAGLPCLEPGDAALRPLPALRSSLAASDDPLCLAKIRGCARAGEPCSWSVEGQARLSEYLEAQSAAFSEDRAALETKEGGRDAE